MKLTIEEIANVVGASNDWRKWANVVVTGVEFDARLVTTNQLFVPLQGGARDGHEFSEQAIRNGADLALWSETVPDIPQDFPVLVVADTLKAFQQLAQYYLAEIAPKVIGITGSNGKTTTKDMVAGVLSQGYRTYKTQGNYNNHIGLPYTILHMPANTEMLVLEMGMDHAGEIEVLSQMAQPDVAAITMVGESHIEFLGSRQGIAQAKMEIVSGLKGEGLLVIPGEERLLAPFYSEVQQRIVTFGLAPTNQISATITQETKEWTSFQTNAFGKQEFIVPVLGNYNVTNALIALTIGDYFGLEPSLMARGLAALDLTKSRTEWLRAANGAEILSDVYNANPTAMGLVIDTFSQLESQGDKYVVLADMGELGEQSQMMHESMATHLDPTKVAEVYLYGSQMAALYTRLQKTFPTTRLHYYKITAKKELVADLQGKITGVDMVMLKGSNSMKLIEIVEKLIEN